MEQPKRRLSAICFADIVGYSELSNRDEPAALALVRNFQALARDIVATYEGRIVKFIGDAVLAEFGSTDSAVRAAVAIQEGFVKASNDLHQPSQLRIVVHLGEVNATPDGDLYGDGVNTASRLQHEAAPGQVIVSEDVWRQLRQRPEFRFSALGAVELRGISAKVEIFDVLFGARAALTPPAKPPKRPGASRKSWGPLWAAIGASALTAIVVIAVVLPRWRAASAPAAEAPIATAPAPAPVATAPPPAAPVSTRTPPPAAVQTPAEPARAAATEPATPVRRTPFAARGTLPGRQVPEGRGQAGAEPGEIRALLDRLATALTSEDRAAVAALGPGALAMSTVGLQQMRQLFGSGLNVRFARIERAQPVAGGGAIRFSLVARSDSRGDTPLLFEGVIDRAAGQLRFVELRRELAAQRGRAGR